MGKPSKEHILKAISGSGGVILAVAKKLDVEWHTAKTYINSYPETQKAFENEEEKILDMADMGLYTAVKEREPWAIKWLQSTKGKKRGYVERHDLGVDAAGSFLDFLKATSSKRNGQSS